jgi:hypothetical protein
MTVPNVKNFAQCLIGFIKQEVAKTVSELRLVRRGNAESSNLPQLPL